jgi:hypothetical protein
MTHHAGDRLVHLAEGLLHRQGMAPILQHVREGAVGQLQAIVQRHKFQGLPLAAAMHGTLQLFREKQ